MHTQSRAFRIASAVVFAFGGYTVTEAAAQNGNAASSSQSTTPTTVGEKPNIQQPAPEALDVFRERSALTKKGTLVIEPSVNFSHTDSNRVAIEAFTVSPALAIGSIDVSQIRRDSLVGALSLRYGLFRRLEVEARFPYVYRKDESRTRPFLMGTNFDEFSKTDGSGLGDIEGSIRYQLTHGLGKLPILIGALRVKSDTGEGPFEVDRETLTTMSGDVIGQRLNEQPTGSGFWAIEPSITAIIPTDPAVFFTNLGYTFNLKQETDSGDIDPGDLLGLDFGLGLSINEKTSMSLGYSHTIAFKTTGFTGVTNQFDLVHVGSFLFGFSHRLSPKLTLNTALQIGVTEDSPDVTVSVRLPFRQPVYKPDK